MAIAVEPKTFQAEVISAEVPVLVDFWGERCLPCRMLAPILEGLAEELEGKLKICKFNTDPEPGDTPESYEEKFRMIVHYDVMNLPTMLVFKEGTVVKTLIGLHTKDELLEELKEVGIS
ncbi:MAG: thioredoxin [Oscillospiraceae bacterium]|jgi:thioredoxin 1|nr:thioredoxin [Oscillospiraceae bacterium]